MSVTLDSFNFSWFPRDDSPRPAADEFFVTIRFRVRNYASTPRTIAPGTLLVLSVEGGIDHVRSLWSANSNGRQPRLTGGALGPGEETGGWLTYRVPKSVDYIDGAVWRPSVFLSIPFLGGGSRVGRGQVFGRVFDASGNPVPGARVEITKVTSYGPDDPPVGNCRGFASSPWIVETGEDGWYSFIMGAIHDRNACLDIRVIPPASSGLAGGHASGGEIWFSSLATGEEPPEARIDLMLDRVE